MSLSIRVALALFADLLLNMIVLVVSYPIWWEFRYQRYPVKHWVEVYSATGILVSILIWIITLLTYLVMKRRSTLAIVKVQIITVFLCLSSLALLVWIASPYPVGYWPDFLRYIAAAFFAEGNFLTFIFVDATSMSLLSGLLFALLLRGRQVVSSPLIQKLFCFAIE
jgi:hypothetical protein